MRTLLLLCLLVAPAAARPTPSPTPTPRARSLADYAERVRIAPTPGPGVDGRIVITDATLRRLAGDGYLTMATAADRPALPTPQPVDPRVKARWQRAHAAQRKVVERLDRRRAALHAQLDRVQDLSPTARTLAREEGLRDDLRELDRELAAARDELVRIVRAARKEGAEPGWFRSGPAR